MNQGKRLVVNTICNTVVLVIKIVVGFILPPFILHSLDKTLYGIWALTGSLLNYSSLLSLGLNSAVNRWVPKYLVEKNTEGINRVVNTTQLVYLIAAGITTIITLILAAGFPYWFQIEPEFHFASRVTVLVVGTGFVCLMMLNAYGAVLSGLQRYDLMAGADIAARFVYVGGVVAVLLNHLGLIALAVVAASSRILRSLFVAVLAKRNCPSLRIDPRAANWATFREMFGYSVNSLLYSSGQAIDQQAALAVIGIMLGPEAVTEYAMPLIIAAFCNQMIVMGASAMKPAATRLDTEQRFSQVSELYLLGTKYALLVLFAVVALILSYGHSIMTIWLKEGFVGKGDVILSVLAVGALFRLWHTPGFYVVVGLGKHRLFGIMTFVNAFFSVSLAIILLIWSGLGVVGVAIGFTVPIVITGVLVIMPYCCRVARVSVWQEVRLSVIPAIVATLPLLGVLSVLRAYFIPHSAMGLLALVSILSVPTLAGWWWLGLSRMERRRFLDMLPAGIGRFRRSRVDGR